MANNSPANIPNGKIVAQTTQIAHSGPLALASEFQHYNEVLPGAADRILKMAETQASSRQMMEKIVVVGGVN